MMKTLLCKLLGILINRLIRCGPRSFERLVLLKVEKHDRIEKFYKTGAIEKYLNP